MQKALSLAVLLGAMLQLQGCGGGDATTAAPAATTVAPTTAAPTDPPPAAAASDLVITGSFTMEGLTATQLQNANVQKAVEKGIATSLGVDAAYVKVTVPAARRLMMGRQLSGLTVSYTITVPKELGVDAIAAIKTTATTKGAALATTAAALTALVDAVKANIAADPDIPADIKTAAANIAVSGLEVPTMEGGDPVTEGNSTRRLSFSFITSDEPLIL